MSDGPPISVCALFLAAAIAWADEAPARSIPPPGPQPIKIGGIAVQGSLRARLEDWNWFEANTGDNAYRYSGNLFRISFSQSGEFLDWQLEFAVPFLLSLPDNSIASGAQGQL